jgi:hypothetical protein
VIVTLAASLSEYRSFVPRASAAIAVRARPMVGPSSGRGQCCLQVRHPVGRLCAGDVPDAVVRAAAE